MKIFQLTRDDTIIVLYSNIHIYLILNEWFPKTIRVNVRYWWLTSYLSKFSNLMGGGVKIKVCFSTIPPSFSILINLFRS